MAQTTHKYSIQLTVAAIIIVLAVLVGVYGAGIYQIFHFNENMEIPEGEENVIVQFKPDEKSYIYSANGAQVIIDMGSRHCFITSQTLERLKAEGYDAQEQQTLLYTTDQSGHYRIYTRKVIMPVYFYADTTMSNVVVFNNVELLISNREEGNILGMDFLEKFAIERDNDAGTVSLLRKVPDNYAYVCDLNGHDSAIGDLFGYSRRVYIPLIVNDQQTQNYYLDTGRGIRACELVQPLKNISKATTQVRTDTATGMATQNNCRVQIGNRMRFATVTYSDSLHTDEYSINPFRVFNNSIVMDLPNKKLYYVKTANPTDSITL